MSLFSKKITTEKITESLLGFFDVDYGSLVAGLKDVIEDQQVIINKEQDKELIVVPMLAIMQATHTAFGDVPATKCIIGKFQHSIFNNYFRDTNEREKFEELFWNRCNEYSRISNPSNKDLAIQFGQIFCGHFLKLDNFADVKTSPQNLAIMMFVGMAFMTQMIGVKKFLDEVMEKCVFDL